MIEDRYLTVIMIPCYIDDGGLRSVDPLWHKDLVLHLAHIRDLTLASPARRGTPPGRLVPIDHDAFDGALSFVDLPPCSSTMATLLSIPAAAVRLWRAIGEADIVHVNAGGWPISFGWIAAPMAKLRGKFVLTNIEGAFWRGAWKRPWHLKPVMRGLLFEVMARFCVNISDIATFTHAGYLESMLSKRRRHRGYVFPASWIDEEIILPRVRAEEMWREKVEARDRPLRVVFAANLLESKGLRVLFEALEILDRRGAAIDARIYGDGPLRQECVDTAGQLKRGVTLTLCGQLAYGAEFFAMLRDQDLLVAPSLSDEQPRIVYDCLSQALPVVGSDTPGLRQCVSHGETGVLVPVGDPRALADALEGASGCRERLRDLGIAGLEVARNMTHDQMHSRRAELILRAMRGRHKAGALGARSDLV